jgi:hypothetical protein
MSHGIQDTHPTPNPLRSLHPSEKEKKNVANDVPSIATFPTYQQKREMAMANH